MADPKAWTAEEERILREMHAAGASDGEISDRIGRSCQGVSNRRRKLRLVMSKEQIAQHKSAQLRAHNLARAGELVIDRGPQTCPLSIPAHLSRHLRRVIGDDISAEKWMFAVAHGRGLV